MIKFGSLFFALIILVSLTGQIYADRLPNATRTNNFQAPSTTNLQLVGMMDSSTEVEIYTENRNNSLEFLTGRGDVMSDLVYKNNMMTNGGYLALAKDQTFDEGSQTKGSNNIDSAIVATYATDSDRGAAMSTSEKMQ